MPGKCQGATARQWLAEREAASAGPCYHAVFTLPAAIGAIAFHNKAVVYDPVVQDRSRNADHHRRRPEASGRAIGLTAVLHTWGSALTPPPPCPRHRPGRRPVARRVALDRLQTGLLPARARSVASVPPPVSRRARSAAQGWPPRLLRRPRPARRQGRLSMPLSRRCAAGQNGSSTPRDPSQDPRPCSPISRATPIALRLSNSRPHRARQGGRHLQMEGLQDQRPRPAQDHDARRRRVHPPLSPPCAAERLPPHPTLRPVWGNGSSGQHRARPPSARRVGRRPPAFARRGRQ